MQNQLCLLLDCQDQPGIVASLSSFVASQGGNIITSDQYSDLKNSHFYIRMLVDLSTLRCGVTGFEQWLNNEKSKYKWRFQLKDLSLPTRMAVMVTKEAHCLYDLLYAHKLGELHAEIGVVISNHNELSEVAKHFGVGFIHTDQSDKKKREQEQLKVLKAKKIETVVLAKYMQILSSDFVNQYTQQIINIHHSFLPAFVGPKPYHQAKEKGVKVIGATAHYVTADLDQGPIIAQDVVHVSHRDEVKDLVQKGREVERRTLTKAVAAHLDKRVIVDSSHTIVFD